MALTVAGILELEVMDQAKLIAGEKGVHRTVRWVHTWPEVLAWFSGGELLLTTGYSWPDVPAEQRRIVGELVQSGIAALLFQTGRYFPEIPPAVKEAGNQFHLPVLSAPPDLSFIDLTEAINREIIRRQYAAIERSEQVHRALSASALEAQDLEAIAHSLASLLSKPILITDPDLRLLAVAVGDRRVACGEQQAGGRDGFRPESEGDWSWHEFLGSLVQSHGVLLGRLRKLWVVRPLGELLGESKMDRLAVHPVIAPIRASGELLGFLWLIQDEPTVDEFDLRTAEHGAIVAGLHLLRQRAVAEAESRVRHSFVETLLRGEQLDAIPGMRERARMLGFDPRLTHQVALVAAAPPGEGNTSVEQDGLVLIERVARSLKNALVDSGFEPFLSTFMRYVAFIIPVSLDDTRMQREAFERVWRRLQEYERGTALVVAVGRPSPSVLDIPVGLDEAERTLGIAREPGIYWYEDCLVARILASIGDRAAARDLVNQTLGKIRGARGGEDLVETLIALVACGFHRRDAARSLDIHWNTMTNRIGRLEAIIGSSLRASDARLRLMLALEIERMMGNGRDLQLPQTHPKRGGLAI